MAELQAPEAQINGNGLGLGGGGGTVAGAAAGVGIGIGIGGGVPVMNSSEAAVGSKRQRRPSVRLGDIGGDQPYDTQARRAAKQWKLPIDHHHHSQRAAGRDAAAAKSSKTRPLVNFSSERGELHETLDSEDREREREANLESMAIGSWKLKESKKRGALATKRIRSNWISSKLDEGGGGGGLGGEIGCGGGEIGDEKYSAGEDIDDGGRDFDAENSESPINSMDNLAVDEREALYHGNRRQIRATRVSDHHSHLHQHHEGVELLSGPSDTEARDWRHGGIGNGGGGEDGVRVWLNGLGLGRYAPVFEIHEVDDEVLPMLTLEDLKDMGINAVGSRRKMFSAIQKLGKGFS